MTAGVLPEFLALQQVLAGRYSIERELGRGGMGIVLLARDVALDRLVAIKLLPPHLARQPEFRQRFLTEARTAAGLSHPNIVPIFLVEQAGELVFFVMGFVDGETLRERVEHSGPLSPRLATQLLQEVAWALAYAHQRGVIHRDIKPDNILLERATDRAMVTDFGIAIGGRGGAGDSGEVIGTASYMSPEQALGESVDARSDLYSLGATMFFAVAGRAPFDAAEPHAVLAQKLTRAAPRVGALRAGLSPRLADLIDRCLMTDPAQRPQTADDIARIAGEIRGRDLRAPPLVRSFVRNAQITTMVVLATLLGGQASPIEIGSGHFFIQLTGVIQLVLIIQLGVVARHLLRAGYSLDDIRVALQAEAEVQREEADVVKERRWVRRLNTAWLSLWAGRVGRWFFRVAGIGLKPHERLVIASNDPTELVLGRSAREAYEALPEPERNALSDVPEVVERLEAEARALRAGGSTGAQLAATVAALENVRVSLLRLRIGAGTRDDLTMWLGRAREIGEQVDRKIEADREVSETLRA